MTAQNTPNNKLSDMLIAEWPRSNSERWRVVLRTYQRRPVVSIRVWYRDHQGQYCPGKVGITISVAQLALLLNALTEAHRIACSKGWIEPEGKGDAAP